VPPECLGLALVRAVDMPRRLLYMLTAVDEDTLSRVTAIAVGRLDLPPSLLQAGAVVTPYLSLFCISAEATGSGGGRARKNVERARIA
jgi:hypothetical protein